MRKYLLGATAAAAGVALALPAASEVTLSGSVVQDIGFGSYVGNAPAADDLHLQTDAEIHFKGTGTTDGGLTVTATVEMDADSNGGIDESNLSIAGGFGSITLGTQDNAANMVGNKGIGNSYAGTGYYDGGENYTPAGSPGPVANSDALGIRYILPAMAGIQAGLSYQVGANADPDGGATTAVNDGNIIAVGMNFGGDFAGTGLVVGANWVQVDPGGNGAKTKSYGVGAGVTIGSTTLSMRYDAKPESVANGLGSATMGDNASFGIGVDHTIGALTFGIGYGSNTDENAVATGAVGPTAAGTGVADTKTTILSGGAKYNLGGGVEIHAAITMGDVENPGTAGCYTAGADAQTDGTVGALPPTGCADGTTRVNTANPDVDDTSVGLRIALSF